MILQLAKNLNFLFFFIISTISCHLSSPVHVLGHVLAAGNFALLVFPPIHWHISTSAQLIVAYCFWPVRITWPVEALIDSDLFFSCSTEVHGWRSVIRQPIECSVRRSPEMVVPKSKAELQHRCLCNAHKQMLYPLCGFQANEYNGFHLSNQKVLSSSH